MATPEEIRSTIDQYVERFCAGDSAHWAELFTEDAHHEDPVGTPVNAGRAGAKAFYDNTAAMFGSVRLELLEEPVIVGSEALVFLTAITGAGESQARVPRIIDHMVFADDGSISSLRAFWNFSDITPDPQ